MITVRTPLRISFLGGGTDFPIYFNSSPGYILGATINKFVYVVILPLPEFAEEKYRFTYRVSESVQDYREFAHPVVREVLRERKWTHPINIATMADLPGRSGLGSSSSFTVGFINGLNHFQGVKVALPNLAMDAINIERNILSEPGGWQDQFHASFGGFRLYRFYSGSASPVEMDFGDDFLSYLSESLVLVPMQNWRDSSGFAEITGRNLGQASGYQLAKELASLTKDTSEKLVTNNPAEKRFHLLCSAINTAWNIKKELSMGTLYPKVIEKIEDGLKKGALAGRLCGAGGTGFLLFLVPPENRGNFLDLMSKDLAFPVSIEASGSKIL